MKIGFIGSFGLGALSAVSEALKIAGNVTQKPCPDFEGIFYATAFQTGIDEFLLPTIEVELAKNSDFVEQRISYIEKGETDSKIKLVTAAFSTYLPEGWETDDEYEDIRRLMFFLTDLLVAMSLRSSLLLPAGIPDFAEVESRLPSNLAQPISLLLSTVIDIQTPSPIPQKAIPVEDAKRFNDIMSSDLFSEYVHAQADLDSSDNSIDKTLPVIVEKGRELFAQNKHVLTLQKSSAGILQITPKIIDAAFGKLPGALADVAAKLGISLLESHQRVVMYDFWPTTQHILYSNLLRMCEVSDDSNEKKQ